MNIVRGSTTSEIKMIKGIQAALGAVVDGDIGTQTMSEITKVVGADAFPLTLKIYDAPVIIAKDILAFNPKAGLKNYSNSLSGSFSYNGAPCSMLVNAGADIYAGVCHGWAGYPETVIYRCKGGAFGIGRFTASSQIPDRANLKWAMGGMGLLSFYDPAKEGFCRFTHTDGKTYDYSDVLRSTNHTVLGVKDGYIYLVYCPSMTAAQVNAFVRDKLKLDMAIMLDGGHVAGINGEESFAKINTSQVQYYAIQAIKG